MIAALLASRRRDTLFLLGVGLIAIVGATAHATVLLNACTSLFTTRLRTRTFPEFVQKLIVFAELPACAQHRADVARFQKSKLVLREGLVEDLPAEWLSPLRAFRLSHARKIGANPDRRIPEDAKHFTELTIERLVQVVEHQE